jgi:ribose/xylose/arabinose/galactoside ABC-type transport system permease subunit
MNEKKLVLKNKLLKDQRILLVLVIILLIIVVGSINGKFVKLTNIVAIFQQISVLGVLTMTMTMLLVSGGIDLSIGNMMTLSGVVVGTIVMNNGNTVVAVLAGIGVSLLCGLLNGLIIAKSKCMPLIITLGTSQIFYGVSLLIAGGSFINFDNRLDFMRKIQLWGIVPLMVIFMLVIVILMYLLLNRTKFGRRIVAIGGNEKNAYLSGINVDLYKIITYGIGGAIIGGAGLIFAARLNAITASAGAGYELDALVAAVIGGVTFEGGRGTVLGAFLGCLLTGIISNALDILGVDAYVKIVITGMIIVLAVVLSNIENARKKL